MSVSAQILQHAEVMENQAQSSRQNRCVYLVLPSDSSGSGMSHTITLEDLEVRFFWVVSRAKDFARIITRKEFVLGLNSAQM